MTLDLNDDQLKAVISGAIVAHLTPEKREELIRQAITSLLSPGGQYDKQSPLQRAFVASAEEVARELIKDHFEKDGPPKEALKAIITEATEKVLVTNRQKTIDAMADKLAEGLKFDRY